MPSSPLLIFILILITLTTTTYSIFTNHTLSNTNRTYQIYYPSNYNSSKSYNVLFSFKGTLLTGTNDKDPNSPFYDLPSLSDDIKNDFIIIFPKPILVPCRDVNILGIKFVKCFEKEEIKWDISFYLNSLSFIPYDSKDRCESKDITFVYDIYDEIEKDININKVYTIGHSNGGYFAYYLTQCDTKGIFSTFISHSSGMKKIIKIFGWVYMAHPIYPKSTNVRGLLVHDINDTVIDVQQSKDLAEHMDLMGNDVSLVLLDRKVNQHWYQVNLNQEFYNFFENTTTNYNVSGSGYYGMYDIQGVKKPITFHFLFNYILFPTFIILLILCGLYYCFCICCPIWCLCEKYYFGKDGNDDEDGEDSGKKKKEKKKKKGKDSDNDDSDDDFRGYKAEAVELNSSDDEDFL